MTVQKPKRMARGQSYLSGILRLAERIEGFCSVYSPPTNTRKICAFKV